MIGVHEEVTAPQMDDLLDTIRDCADQLGIDAYLVGGFVRDRLLGRPGKDIDLLVTGEGGLRLLQCVANRFGWSRPQQFDRFQTAQIRGDGFVVEVVQARSESYDPMSRKPDVAPGSLEDDIWRRDFTVNALCQTLTGEVIDVTGRGLDDLRRGVLRTPLDPGETFAEDPLRMLRAARFRAQLGFQLASGIPEAMRRVSPRTAILSVERISEELRRLLVAPYPGAGFEVLREGALLDPILPEIAETIGVEQSGYHIHDVYDHTLHALDLSPPDLVTRVAVLCHDIGKPPTHQLTADGRHTFHNHDVIGAEMSEQLLSRLRFSNDEIAAVATLVRNHLRPIAYTASGFSDAAVRRLIRDLGPLRERMLDVARADTRASAYPDTAAIDELGERMVQLDQGGTVSHLVAPLDGEEIMALAGRGPGPWVGRIKRALLDAVVEGELGAGDKDAARAWLKVNAEVLEAE